MANKIADAQKAILAKGGGTKFSRNVVCIEIESGDCHDLSIVDLPGLIESSDTKEDEIYITLIHDLVRSYLSNHNTGACQATILDSTISLTHY